MRTPALGQELSILLPDGIGQLHPAPPSISLSASAPPLSRDCMHFVPAKVRGGQTSCAQDAYSLATKPRRVPECNVLSIAVRSCPASRIQANPTMYSRKANQQTACYRHLRTVVRTVLRRPSGRFSGIHQRDGEAWLIANCLLAMLRTTSKTLGTTRRCGPREA